MSILESFYLEIETELGHTPLVEAVEAAASVIFDEPPAQMEGIGDAIAGIGKKLGKAAAIGALAFGAANAANAPGAHNDMGNAGAGGNGGKACVAQMHDLWNSPQYQELETKYLQQELDLQQKQVDSGKRSYVDEQRAYEKAQHRATHDVACSAK